MSCVIRIEGVDLKEQFTQREVNQIFNHIPSRTLLFWATEGLVGWQGENQDGRGRHRLYSIGDLYRLSVVEELTSLGVPLEAVKWIVNLEKFDMGRVLAIAKMKHGREGMHWDTSAFLPEFVDPVKGASSPLERWGGAPSCILLYLPEIAKRVRELVEQSA